MTDIGLEVYLVMSLKKTKTMFMSPLWVNTQYNTAVVRPAIEHCFTQHSDSSVGFTQTDFDVSSVVEEREAGLPFSKP